MANIHVKFKGQSADLDSDVLGVSSDSGNGDILERIAQHFDRAIDEFSEGYDILREENGNITIRPKMELG